MVRREGEAGDISGGGESDGGGNNSNEGSSMLRHLRDEEKMGC